VRVLSTIAVELSMKLYWLLHEDS